MTVNSAPATTAPFGVKSRILVYPLPRTVSPKALKNLLASQIGLISKFIDHRISASEWMAEVTFVNNVGTHAVTECESQLDQRPSVQTRHRKIPT